MGGYQKFSRRTGAPGSLFVYPITANAVFALPAARFRPYVTAGGGAYGWESQIRTTGVSQLETAGWSAGWTAGGGLEYYLRPHVAFDVALRYHRATGRDAVAQLGPDGLRFTTLWIGHYLRF
jgi:opacity protein-like surface antigen